MSDNESKKEFKTLSFEEIAQDMEKYIDIDPMSRNLDQTALLTGRAFMTAQRHNQRESALLVEMIQRKDQLELHLTRYYGGTANSQTYISRPLLVSPATKSEIPSWIKADPLYIELNSLVEEQKRKVKFIESCFDRIRQMGYDIKNAIEWRKYLDGN